MTSRLVPYFDSYAQSMIETRGIGKLTVRLAWLPFRELAMELIAERVFPGVSRIALPWCMVLPERKLDGRGAVWMHDFDILAVTTVPSISALAALPTPNAVTRSEPMTETRMRYSDAEAPDECPSCLAWYAEYQRVALLFERLAEDRFPDQATFDAWVNKQMTQALRSPAAALPTPLPRDPSHD